MSEINSAEIKVGLDATGVEAGLLKIDQAATRTGRTVESLGRANGFQQLGAGAEDSGARVGRTTQNLVASIKRTTEAMSAGTRGTAEYYSQLANSRGANLAQLQPYINQLREVTERTQAAAAAQRQLAARDDFLSSLRDQADAVGKTAAELMEMRAAELGVTEAAQPLIDRLREAEEASGGLGEAISSVLGPAAALAAVMGGLYKTISVQREFDGLNSGLITATGSAENAAQAFKALQAFAATTPYSLAETTAAFIQMRNLGLDPSERALRSYGNTAAAMSKSLEQMVEAVADASTGEFERLKEFGIKASQNGDQVALTFQGVTTTVRNSADEIETYLQKLGETKFGGGMELQANTLSGAISNLGDAWDAAFLKISQGGIGEAAKNSTLGVSAALTDLVAILDAAAGAADAHSSSLSATTVVHEALRTAFEAVTVLGINVAYVLTQIGKELGGLAAQAVSVAKGEFAEARRIGQMMREEAEQARKDVDARSEAILTASARARKAAEEEAAAKKASGRDDLARFKIAREAEQASEESARKAAAAAKAQADAYRDLREAIEQQAAAVARDAAGLDPLTRTQELQIRLDKELLQGKVKLSKEVEASLRTKLSDARADEISAAMQKRVAQGNEERARAAEKVTESLGRQVAEAVKEAERNEDLARTFGMTRKEIEGVTLARLEEKLAQEQSKKLWSEEIDALEQIIAAKKRSMAAMGSVDAQEAAKRANEVMTADWTRTVEKYEDVFRQGFADMLNTGKDGWKSFTQSLVTTFKTSVADQIYKMFAQPFVVKMVGSLMGVTGGATVAGAAQAATTAAQAPSLLATAGNAYSLVSGGMTLAGGLGTGFLGSIAGGLNGAGIGSGLASATGLAIGEGIAGVVGESAASAIASGMSTVAAAMPWLAGIAVGAVVLKKAFGRGPKEATGTQLNGSFGMDGSFSGSADTEWIKKGGWLRSDKRGVDSVALDASVAAQFTAGYEALKMSAADFAKTLGVNADSIKDRAQKLSIALTGDKQKDAEAVAKFFTGVGDQIATELVPTIAQFSKAATEFGGVGETASQTLQRIATNYVVMDEALRSIGDTFGAVGLDSVAARERLLELTGGLEAFGKGTAFFAQNFLTEAERLAPIQKTVTDTLGSMGLAWVDTREEFKNVVLGLDLTTESGAKTYASLMGLQEQFAALYPFVDAAADAINGLAEINKGYQDRIDEVAKSMMSAAQVRALETAGMDASTVALYDRLKAITAEAKALEERKSLQQQLDDLMLSPAEKLARQRAAIDSSNQGLFDMVQAATAAQEALAKFNSDLASIGSARAGIKDRMFDARLASQPISAQIETLRQAENELWTRVGSGFDSAELLSQIENFALKRFELEDRLQEQTLDSLKKKYAIETETLTEQLNGMVKLRDYAVQMRDFANGLKLGGLAALSPQSMLAEAESQYRDMLLKAQAGDENAQGNLKGAAQSYLELQKQFSGSTSAYVSTFNSVISSLEQFASVAPSENQIQLQRAQITTILDTSKSLGETVRESGSKTVEVLARIDQAYARMEESTKAQIAQNGAGLTAVVGAVEKTNAKLAAIEDRLARIEGMA